MRLRKAFVGALSAAVLLGGAAGFHALDGGASEAAAAPAAPPPVPVVAGTVKSGNVPIYLRGIGTVTAYNTVLVHSQIQGQLVAIPFTEGQFVHKGDLLAQIDPRPYQAALDQAIANRDRDQANLRNAEVNFKRDAVLLPSNLAVSKQQYDNDNATVAQLRAQVEADKAAIETACVNLSFTRLTSPVDGVTGIRQIDIGNIIYPNSSGLVTVTQIQPIAVIFTLPEQDLIEILQRMQKAPLTVLAYSQDDKALLSEGKLLLVNNEINQTTGTLQLKAIFPNRRSRLWPGELVDARLLLETRPHGLTVAARSVQQGPDGAYVYVIEPDGTVANRAVMVAQFGNKRAVIDTGLTAGERVVVDGQSRLHPGSRVVAVTGRAAEEVASEGGPQMVIP
jgi:membrane fusion protein, multidrug efflux system